MTFFDSYVVVPKIRSERFPGFQEKRLFSSKQEVTSFLETAGLTKSNPYYIVKQGKINQLSLCKDEERLKLLKSIAGATSFEKSLNASQLELNATDLTLEQIELRIVGIKVRMAELNVESVELQEFLETDKTKRLLERAICMKELKNVKTKLAQMSDVKPHHPNLLDQQKSLKGTRDEIKDLKSAVYNEEHESRQCSHQIKDLRKHKEHLEKEVIRLQIKLEGKYKEQQDGTQLRVHQNRLAELDAAIQERKDQLKNLRQQNLDVHKAKHDSLKKLDQKKQKRSKLARYGNFANQEERDAWINSELQLVLEQLEDKNARITQQEAEIEDIEHKKGELQEEIDFNITKKEHKQETILKITADLKELRKRSQDTKDIRMDIWREINLLEKDVEILKKDEDTKRRNIKCAIGKSMLDGIISVEIILREFKLRADPDAMLVNEGYLKMVVETFNCDETLYTAVNVTAGRKLFYHIVKFHRVATLIIKELNRQSLPGEAYFIALDTVLPYREELPRITQEICTNRTGAKPLMALLQYEKYDEANNVVQERALQQIWYNTFICRDLDEGTQLAKLNENFQFVTMEGDIVRKGSLTGGYCDPRWSKIRLHREFFAAQEQFLAKKEQLTTKQRQTLDLDARIEEMDVRKAVQKTYRDKYMDDIKVCEGKIENLGKEYAVLEKMRRHKAMSLMSLRADVECLNQRVASLEAELAQEMISQLTAQQIEEFNGLNLEIEELKKEAKQRYEDQIRLNREMNDIENLIEERQNREKKDIEEKICEFRDVNWQNEIDKVKADLERHNIKIKQTEAKIQDLTKRQSKADEDVKVMMDLIESHLVTCATKEAEVLRISNDYHKSLAQKSKLKKEESLLNEKLTKMGPVPNLRRLDDLSKMTLEQMYRQQRDCNQRLHELENVNQKALQQFQDMQTTLQQLETRNNEVQRARAVIVRMMEDLQHRKNETISLTFKQVRENFRTVFHNLVPDGRASLELVRSDSQSSLSNATPNIDSFSGFAIRVSFIAGGMEMVDLAQLSGGQKTTVSFALILALQACDPAPFYLFDEIDQALDPMHRERVADLIQNRSHHSQFICTTFRQELVERGDQFFRVAYRDKVSRIVPVDKNTAIHYLQP